MRKRNLLLGLLMMPLMVMAGEVKSPNGNIVLNFSLDAKGRPTYEMSYKGRPVVLQSRL